MKKVYVIIFSTIIIGIAAVLLYLNCDSNVDFKKEIQTVENSGGVGETKVVESKVDARTEELEGAEPAAGSTDDAVPTIGESTTDETQLSQYPQYVPGSIILGPEEGAIAPFGFERHYRNIFYTIPGVYMDLVPGDKLMTWTQELESNHSSNVEPSEMLLVRFVEEFEISREAFEEVTSKLSNYYSENAIDSQHETNEVPNVDVIYSFDNQIIKDYYRYE